ncbi:phage protein GemA/Gp16 family protein [Meridianimarinicoccus aquatilis]|uniref:phage protein GemA/Gp16 family protein n=1 Tax=Meridianimarinicoccus aquatilis TaxID=2552766 RepID=UPI001FB737F8|nr:phage protein GemA/Gp16 family protein [Fluviibacterium aquatile]
MARIHGRGQENSLNKWLLRCFKVSSLRFLKKEQGQKAITALKAMKTRVAA